MRCVVVGARSCGKTAICAQLAHIDDALKREYTPTFEDTYQLELANTATTPAAVSSNSERSRGGGGGEILILHDTAGVTRGSPAELKRAHMTISDAYILVYSILSDDSFAAAVALKQFIE